MKLKSQKINSKKTALWMGSVTFGFLLIFLLIIFSIHFSNKKEKLCIAIESIFSVIFVYILFICLTFNRMLYQSLIRSEKIIYEDETTEIKFKLSIYVYLLIIVVSIAIFVLFAICFKTSMNYSVSYSFKKTAPFDSIIFIYIIIYSFLYINIFKYLLNENLEIKEEILENIKTED